MAFLIFILTLLCIYIRPFKLPLWVYSSLGALLCLGFGVVGFADVAFVWGMVWDSTLTLVGLIIFCIVLEKLLFFDFLAYKILRFLSEKGECGGISSLKFYVFIVLFGGFLGAFFANDGAILILTPLIIALFGKLDSKDMESKLDSKNSAQILTPLVIFLLIVSFVSDFASNTFVISNLTNIIALHFFNLNALDFSKVMALPQIFIIIASLCFFILVRKRLPRILRVKIPNAESSGVESHIMPQKSVIIICFALLFLLLCGIFIANAFALPLSSFTLLCAALSLVLAYKKIEILPCLQASPFGIVVFSLGLFIVVFGLHSTSSFMRDIFAFFLDDSFLQDSLVLDSWSLGQISQIFSVGAISSLGSSLINNLPMVMLGNLALGDFVGLDSSSRELLIYAHLLGCNVGAKLTPIGSLATLLWLFSLKRYGIYISFWQYMLVAMLVVPFMLCMGLLGLVVYAVL
ncbi:arsenic transporter [uncultured Helicobacter sp.]|uniref:arsenic transporter n=1 Tax=uncultured Helicobacter sp. TaxID=175537 RepID=UPI0025D1F11D|nr:arsenic transporter [uncultured Helicobacter sp.]